VWFEWSPCALQLRPALWRFGALALLLLRGRLGIPLPFNRVVLFLITLLQITIICLGNYITPNQTMPHGELNTQRLLKGHTVKSSPPHIYILIYNGHQISLV
jgi:hypothetical protein